MSDRYVQGDSWVGEHRLEVADRRKLEGPILLVLMLAALALFLTYGIFGGRGWLAGALVSAFGYVIQILNTQHDDTMFMLRSMENRLRFIEDDTHRTVGDLDAKSRRERDWESRL